MFDRSVTEHNLIDLLTGQDRLQRVRRRRGRDL